VFGQLLSEDAAVDCGGTTQIVQEPESVGGKEDDAGASASSPSPRDVDPNLREHMVGILFSRKKLSSLQKKVRVSLSAMLFVCSHATLFYSGIKKE